MNKSEGGVIYDISATVRKSFVFVIIIVVVEVVVVVIVAVVVVVAGKYLLKQMTF